MNDEYNRSWPGQEPDEPRPAPRQGGGAPRRPQPGGPQWPGEGQQPGWPAGGDPDGGPTQRRVPPAGRPTPPRQPGTPPPGPNRGGYQPPPPPSGPPNREPGLLTHSPLGGAGGYPEDDYDDYDDEQDRFNEFGSGDESSEEEPTVKDDKAALTPKQRKKRRWKIVRRTLYVLFGLFVIVPAIGFTVSYFLVDVPTPEEVLAQQSQVVTYYYGDNSVMGKEVPDTGNREILKPGQIPETVKHAVYAAEDATFETNNGFDVIGIARAAYNNVTGGSGGGSTISQQYIKKATENEAPTLTRKATELVKSFKMNQTQPKEDIITAYLNIVYFGRNAYGIQAAAHAYFNKDAAQLSPSEAALLAGLIQGPSKSENTEYAQWRWNYVMDNMVKYQWLPAAERQAAQFPTPLPKDQTKPQAIKGPEAFIQAQVEDELDAAGYSKEKLQAGGYNIYTTIDPSAQKLMEDTAHKYMDDQPAVLKNAMVAVDPKTRGVIAYYGGPNDKTNAVDWGGTKRNPGSSFKAFDVTAFFKMGKGLGETFDGTTHRQFGTVNGKPRYINNAGASNSCSKECTVAEAMMRSTNTVFFDLVANVTGPQAVKDAAKEAGVTGLDSTAVDNNIALGGGTTEVTPLDMASGYATFADDGIAMQRHFVSKVTDPGGNVVFQTPSNPAPAFADNNADKSKQIAGNVTMALKPVIDFSKLKCPPNHECAGKTGTQQYDASGPNASGNSNDNSQVWMVGYTPSIAVSSWVGTGGNQPLKDKNGKAVGSGGLPAQMWQEFMNNYLKDKPAEKFSTVQPIGKAATASGDESTTTKQTTTTTTTTQSSTTTQPTTTTESPSSSSRTRPSIPTGIIPTGPGRNGFGGTTVPTG
ncbi:transglycosylase domain-containing protein [Amycolatopsis acidiphila]|uniref:Penicillin-binding protein n=1 Tax=Amycolatopsis acidiphila TaxID=715473 RepID=A0A558A6N8_9PSEU|nr:transglycosylase domain-containing protein [Amycolatopsis acidiphila]TVT19921.1 penicillin-binding protein [Amycolatopsis acidiphila]UIJ60086.1 transglycosylase domain-containing protein [Amycolatopsis acidiphila]GHG61441.1 penicillin-binding protein [Amycolatopsis acidiphila]